MSTEAYEAHYIRIIIVTTMCFFTYIFREKKLSNFDILTLYKCRFAKYWIKEKKMNTFHKDP